MKTKVLAVGALLVVVAIALSACGVGNYNRLVALQEAVEGQWAQVENVYQRRADLIPNLVETVKGAAAHERETLQNVIEARSRVAGMSQEARGKLLEDPAAFEKYQKAQDQLSGALSRLLVVVEQYPQLQATSAFRDLMTQLEGTENRITVERMRFNEAARAFNTERRRFPTVVVAQIFGDKFDEKPYFRAREGAESAPQVKF